MPYLSEKVIEEAERWDKVVSLYVKELSRSGMVGVKHQNMYLDVKAFLMNKKIKHSNNSRRMIWLDDIDPGLIEIFKK